MINRKLGGLLPRYQALRELAQESANPLLRQGGLLLLAAEMLSWFEARPELELLKLTTVVLPRVDRAEGVSVSLRHHAQLTAIGAEVPGTDEAYLVSHLPWRLLGEGVLEVSRDTPEVREYIELARYITPWQETEEQEALADALVHALARRMDRAIGAVATTQDFGH